MNYPFTRLNREQKLKLSDVYLTIAKAIIWSSLTVMLMLSLLIVFDNYQTAQINLHHAFVSMQQHG